MRKIISLALVATMLVCGIVIPATTASAKAELENNVEAIAHYFDGNVVYKENSGTKGDSYLPAKDVKSGNTEHTLTIDGVIDEGEWGDVVVHVDGEYAASNKTPIGSWIFGAKNDAAYTHPSAENTYFFGNNKASTDTSFYDYDLYFMWDEDYLYVGAHVNDSYNHQNVKMGADCWEGDALQFMVDTKGPNSASAALGRSYSDYVEHGVTNDDGSTTSTYANVPWKDSIIGSGGTMYSSVPNFIVAYSTSNGGYTEAWDAAPRYYPETHQAEMIDHETGESSTFEYTTWTTASVAAGYEGYQDKIWKEQNVGVYSTVRPMNHGTTKDPDYTTDYEIAIPWEIVTRANLDGTFEDTFAAEAGKELGITVTSLNASKPGNGTYDSWLTWGSGVCGSQTQYDYQTAGGSNLLTLSGESYKSYKACDHSFAAASCVAPETCTKCGYQRGFETGHSYVCTDEVLPTADADGSVKATCTVCGDIKTLTLGANDSQRFFGFSEKDTSIPTEMAEVGSGWTVNWYDESNDPYTPERDGKMLYFKDSNGQLRAKNSFDNWTFPGISVADCAGKGEGLYYVDGTPATLRPSHTAADGVSTVPEVRFSTQTGTYFSANTIGRSYSYKMEIMPTDYTHPVIDWYTKGIYNWFGKNAADYFAGLFVFGAEEEGVTPTYLFAIGNTDKCFPLFRSEDLGRFEENCIVYKEVPYEKVKTGEWHQWVFIYDDDAQYASLYWDGEQQVSAYDTQFKYLPDKIPYALLRRMTIPFYAKNIDYASTAYAASYFGAGEKYTATINGEAKQYAAGETVTLNAVAFYKDDAAKCHRFLGWTGVETDNAAETSFVMPAHDVTVDAEYCIVGDITNDGKINAADAVQIKKIIVGSAARVSAADIDNDGKWNAGDASNLKKMVVGKFTPVR